jgi:small ubiquitin-related modifier
MESDSAIVKSEPAHSKAHAIKFSFTIVDGLGEKTIFNVKRTTKFGRVKEEYGKLKGVQMSDLRFFFDGERIDDAFTPDSMELPDGVTIDCMQNTTGGRW